MQKKILILLALLISVQSETLSDFDTFTTELWSQFTLPNPSTLQACFNDTTASDFFDLIANINLVSNDILTGNSSNYMLFDLQDEIIDLSDIRPEIMCSVQTEDFKSLLTALQFENPSQFTELSLLYTSLWSWASSYPALVHASTENILTQIEGGNFTQAGIEAAIFLDQIDFSSLSINSSSYNMLSFYNGIFLGLNLPFPSQASQCFAQYNESLPFITTFYNELFEKVGTVKYLLVYYTTYTYYGEAGKRLYEKVPSGLWSCLNATSDAQAFKSLLGYGLDLYDPCYTKAMLKFISVNIDSSEQYGATMSTIKDRYLPNYFQSGFVEYKTLLKAISTRLQAC